MKVLFISAWYPHRYDNMSGLFVQKHAEAVHLYADVKVLYVHADENVQDFEIIDRKHNDLNEVIVYYPIKPKSVFHKLTKSINYFRAYKKGFKYIHQKGFFPDIIHANILTRTGFIAHRYAKKRKIPYIITEHWSRYLPIRNSYHGAIRKWITKRVIKNAAAVLPVSENLKNAMLQHNLDNPNYVVVNNVVENFFFEEEKHTHSGKKRILHVSCFDEAAKNIKGIVNVTYQLSKKRSDFELILIGNGIDYNEVYNYTQSVDFKHEIIQFIGEKTPKEVSEWLHKTDFFVLFSNYENSPVVISESLASGLPVLATNVGGIPELINKKNGILIEPKDEKGLFQAMDYMLDHYKEYNIEEIKDAAKKKFSYQEIGKQIFQTYNTILSKQ